MAKIKDFYRNFKTKFPRINLIFWVVLWSFLVITFFSTSTSFIYPLTNVDSINLDSNFFLYEGYALVSGKIPYIEFYDHKGLYHVLINAFGVVLGGRYGVFLLQIIYLSFTLYFLYLTVKLWSDNPYHPILAVFIYSLFLFCLLGGNAEGEWLMPFITLSLFFYTKGIKTNSDKAFLIGSFFLGLEMGLALNSRPTDAMWGAAIAIYYIVYWARHKKDLNLLFNVLIAVSGLLIPFIIILPWAIHVGFLKEMFSAIYLGNASYVLSGTFDLERLINQIGIIIVFTLILLSYLKFKKKENVEYDLLEMYFVVFCVTLFCYLLIAKYTHYYLTALSFLSSYIVFLLSKTKLSLKWTKRLNFIPVTAISIIALVFVSGYYSFGVTNFSYRDSLSIKKAVEELPLDKLNDEDFFAVNCDPAVYLIAGVESSFPYFANQSWWGKSNPKVIEETNNYLKEECPYYLLVGKLEATMVDFGETINELYSPIETIDNPHFTIYTMKTIPAL